MEIFRTNMTGSKVISENKLDDLFSKTIMVVFMALAAQALWGSAFPCIKIGYRLFAIDAADTASQILFAGMRFTLAGIMVILVTCITAKKMVFPKKTSWGLAIKLCMLQTVVQYLFFYMGLARTTGVRASIVEGLNVFFALLTASILFRQEKLTTRKIIGCAIGFAGVILVNVAGVGSVSGNYFTGDVMIILSALSSAFSSVCVKIYSKKESPVVLCGYQFLFGGLILCIAGAILGGRIDNFTSSGILMLIYLAFISAAAYSLWSILLKYNPVSKVAVFGFANPVFGVIFSSLFLHEGSSVGIMCLISLVLVCLGIFIVNTTNTNNYERKTTHLHSN